jgi:hypothetical protein|nr:MAG TPA: hypothetical protein [Caudoviricetes sp.]
MAKATLPTNYQDDVLKSTMGGKRRYTMTDNSDGTKTLEDATQYEKVGSNFGAADINKTNTAVNAAADASKIIDNVNDIKANTQAGYMMGALAGKQLISDLGGLSFYEDNTGKYVVGADSVPKKLGSDLKIQTKSATYPMAGVNGEQTVDFSVVFDGISGYKLAYAGIQQLNTYISNGTIKYVEFTSQRISGNTVTWSVHTQRGTGGGNNTCVVQGIFIPT